jgi:hypothetical protein
MDFKQLFCTTNSNIYYFKDMAVAPHTTKDAAKWQKSFKYTTPEVGDGQDMGHRC